jgi:hypothetical protein
MISGADAGQSRWGLCHQNRGRTEFSWSPHAYDRRTVYEFGRVGRGGFPPRPPTDPCMPNSGTRLFRPRIRPWPCGHGLVMLSAVVVLRWNQGSVSPASFPPAASWPGAPFPQRGPSGRFPHVTGNMRRSDSLPPLPPHFVAFAWRYHGCTRVSFPWPPGAPTTSLELVTRYLPPGSTVEATGPPRFLGNPCGRVLLSDPGGIASARPFRRRDVAFRRFKNVGSHEDITFRGSITRPTHSLSTLRSPGRPGTTQDSLPAVGQLCRTGLVTRRVPMKGFRFRFLLSQAFLAH